MADVPSLQNQQDVDSLTKWRLLVTETLTTGAARGGGTKCRGRLNGLIRETCVWAEGLR
jgi:hypothetical protein